MTKIIATTRRPKPAAEEEKRVEVTSTQPAEVKSAPTVKRMLEPAPEAPAPKVRAAKVELVEGSSYEVHGVRFISGRPVVVTDQRILSTVSVNSRFRVTGVEGGEK
jgi:hypothetical protein